MYAVHLYCIYTVCIMYIVYTTLLIKTTAARNEVALSYHRVRGLYFLAVVFAATIYIYVSINASMDHSPIKNDWPLYHKHRHNAAIKNHYELIKISIKFILWWPIIFARSIDKYLHDKHYFIT